MHKDLSCEHVGEASWVLLQNLFIVFSWKFIDKNFQPSNRIIFQNITSTSCMLYRSIIPQDFSYIELQNNFYSFKNLHITKSWCNKSPVCKRKNLTFILDSKNKSSLYPFLASTFTKLHLILPIVFIVTLFSTSLYSRCHVDLTYNIWTVTYG